MKQFFCHDFVFQQFGRSIALAEREYLQKQILKNDKIPKCEIAFTPDEILNVIEKMGADENQPDTIFLTSPQYVETIIGEEKLVLNTITTFLDEFPMPFLLLTSMNFK